MLRSAMRTLLRRYVKDTSATEWSDNELNEILNLAYAQVQTELQKSHSESHVILEHMDSELNTNWYPIPQSFSVQEVSLKPTSADTSWVKLDYKEYNDIRSVSSTKTYWTKRGQWIGIFPAPSETVTSGLELWHNSILQMADDDETPRMKLPLHIAIVYKAADIALGDTDESGALYKARYEEVIAQLPLWYDRNLQGEKFQVSV